jgi:hypothetical protein
MIAKLAAGFETRKVHIIRPSKNKKKMSVDKQRRFSRMIGLPENINFWDN